MALKYNGEGQPTQIRFLEALPKIYPGRMVVIYRKLGIFIRTSQETVLVKKAHISYIIRYKSTRCLDYSVHLFNPYMELSLFLSIVEAKEFNKKMWYPSKQSLVTYQQLDIFNQDTYVVHIFAYEVRPYYGVEMPKGGAQGIWLWGKERDGEI